MTLTHVNSQGVKDDSLVNADVATNAAILASKLSHTQSQTGAVARTLANRFADSLSVTDFGALGNNNENSATTNRAAIQAALDAASGSKAVFLPVGTYYVDDTIVIPSHTYFVGQGEKSVIKMKSDVGRYTTLVRTGKRDDKKKHITIEHMTLDFNRARWDESGGTKLTDPRINDGTVIGSSDSRYANLTYNIDNGGDNDQSNNSGTLVICFSEHVLINNVRCLDAYKHCFDITSPKYRKGQANSASSVVASGRRCVYDTVVRSGTSSQSGYVITVSLTGHGFSVDDYINLDLPNTARDMGYRVDSVINANSFTVRSETSSSDSGDCTITQDQGSRHVTLRNCYAMGAGDDNITTHYSSDILIEGCVSERTSGVLVDTNCNAYEIDDGSRNVTIRNCTGIECVKGLQIKGHTYAPAPYNIVIDGLRIVNCCQGVDIRHTGYEDVARTQTSSIPQGERSGEFLGGGRVRTEDGSTNLFDYTGVSPTGRNVSLSNIQIIAPRVKIPLLTTGLPDTNTSNHYDTLYGVRLTAFENVQFTNIIISDGRLDAAEDYKPRETTASDYQALFRVMYGARNVKIQNLAVYGFDDIDESLHVSESVIGPVVVDGYTSINGPKTAARITGASQNYHGCLNNYHFFRDASTRINSNSSGTAIGTGDYGIYCTVDDFHIGEGDIIGYTNNYYQYGAYSLGRTLPAVSLYNPKNTDVSGNPDYTYGTGGNYTNGENINFLNVQYNHGGFAITSDQDRVTVPSHGLYMVLAAIGGSRTGGGSSSDTNAVLLDLVRKRSGTDSNVPGDGTNVMFSTGASDGEEWFVTMAHVVKCEKGDSLNLELNSLETGSTALHQGVIDRGYFHVHKVG